MRPLAIVILLFVSQVACGSEAPSGDETSRLQALVDEHCQGLLRDLAFLNDQYLQNRGKDDLSRILLVDSEFSFCLRARRVSEPFRTWISDRFKAGQLRYWLPKQTTTTGIARGLWDMELAAKDLNGFAVEQ